MIDAREHARPTVEAFRAEVQAKLARVNESLRMLKHQDSPYAEGHRLVLAMYERVLAAATLTAQPSGAAETGGITDTQRLNALERLAMDTPRVGNGIAVFPATLVATGATVIDLVPLDDEDGSDLGVMLTSGGSLRAALDTLLTAPAGATESAE